MSFLLALLLGPGDDTVSAWRRHSPFRRHLVVPACACLEAQPREALVSGSRGTHIVMDMDDWVEPQGEPANEAQQQSDDSMNEPSSKRGRGRPKGKAKANKGAARASAGRPHAAPCFCCPKTKKTNSKWCAAHHSTVESITYQAKRDNQMEALSQVLGDPVKALKAIEDFERESPPGRFRRQLIDWSMWRRRYGVKRAVIRDENEDLMDLTDFMHYTLTVRQRDAAWARKEWERMKDNPQEFEQEGEEPNLKIWVPMRATRKRRHEEFIEGAVEEGSKSYKDMKKEDMQKLQTFAHTSAASYGNKFFKGARSSADAAASLAKGDMDLEVMVEPKGRAVEIAIAAPKQSEKQAKKVPPVTAALEKALELAGGCLDIERNNPAPGDKLQSSYLTTLNMRLVVARALKCTRVDEAKALLAEAQELASTASVAGSSAASAPPSVSGVSVASSVGGWGTSTPAASTLAYLNTPEKQSDAADQDSNIEGEAQGPGAEAKAADAAIPAAVAAGGEDSSALAAPTAAAAATGAAAFRAPLISPKKSEGVESASTTGATSKRAHERVSVIAGEIMKSGGQRANMVHDPSTIICLETLNALTEDMMYADSVDKLDAMVLRHANGLAGMKMVAAGVTKAAKTLKDHIEGKQRSLQRQAAKKEKDKQQEAAAQLKKKTKETAKEIEKAATEVGSAFNLDYNMLVEKNYMTKVVEVSGKPQDGKISNINAPALFANHPAIDELLARADIQVTLGSYGGSYSKTPSCKEFGKAAQPLFASEGKPAVDDMFSHFMSFVGDALVEPDHLPEGIQSPFKAAWLFGFSDKYTQLATTPNSMGMLRLLCAGEVTTIMFEGGSLAAAFRQIKGVDKVTMVTLSEWVKNLNADDMAKLSEVGCKPHVAVQGAKQLLYVPVGHIVLEKASKGVLLYGVRKAVVVKSERAALNYETMVGCLRAEGKETTKMCVALEVLRGDGD